MIGLSPLLALAAPALYLACIVGANWAIAHVGTCVAPGGPCLIPVGWGLLAPSGVLFVGFALFARDLVQDLWGRRVVVAVILTGALLSAGIVPPGIALASGVAFLASELADFAVYTPLREAGRHPWAVFASGLVGGFVDSALFLFLAFGSLSLLLGQWVGKTEVTVLCALLVAVVERLPAARRRAGSAA